VPTWATQQQPVKGTQLPERQSLKFTGMTGDSSAIIIDTSKGLRLTE